MSTLNCKSCGGNIIFTEGSAIGKCDSCGAAFSLQNNIVKNTEKKDQTSEFSMFDLLVDDEEKERKQQEREQIRQRQMEEELREKEQTQKIKSRFQEIKKNEGRIAVNENNTAVINADGTVDIVGDTRFIHKCNTDDWRDVFQVNLAEDYALGLKRDGTVVFAGGSSDRDVQREILTWRDIISISSANSGSCGLKVDGTVVTAGFVGGEEKEIKKWRDIVAVSSCSFLTAGVKKDGTVVLTGQAFHPEKEKERMEIPPLNWSDIISVSVNICDVIGLKSDGTIVVAGSGMVKQSNIADWRDIIAVDSTAACLVGLKADGKVVSFGDIAYGYEENALGQENLVYEKVHLQDWCDIVAVSVGEWHIVGMKSDGSYVSTGKNNDGRCNLTYEHRARLKAFLVQERQSEKWGQQGLCKHCGGTRKGWLMKKCTVCGK